MIGYRQRPFVAFVYACIDINSRKCGSASYIVREVRSVCVCVCERERERERERDRQTDRERYREREREIDGSDITLVALKLAKNFALFLAKICTSVSPLVNGAEFTLSFAKNVALFETVRNLPKIRTLRNRSTSVK